MRTLLLLPFIISFLFGCQSKNKSQYEKCMDSGAAELYGKEAAQDFCNCFSVSIISSKSPFETGNRCAKPIIEGMQTEAK